MEITVDDDETPAMTNSNHNNTTMQKNNEMNVSTSTRGLSYTSGYWFHATAAMSPSVS